MDSNDKPTNKIGNMFKMWFGPNRNEESVQPSPSLDIRDLRYGSVIMYDGWHPDLVMKNIPITPYPVTVVSTEFLEKEKYHVIEGSDPCARGSIACFAPIKITRKALTQAGFSDQPWAELDIPVILDGATQKLVVSEWDEGYIILMDERNAQYVPLEDFCRMNLEHLEENPGIDLDEQGIQALSKYNSCNIAYITYIHELQNILWSVAKMDPKFDLQNLF